MQTRLDASHICLIKKWDTFKKMKQCAVEADWHLVEAVRLAIADLKRRYGPDLKILSDKKLLKEEWFDAYPARLERFGGIGMRFGIEFIAVENLTVQSSENPCRAYAYCPNGEEKPVLFLQAVSFLAKLPTPAGFSIVDNPPAYYLTKTLPIITAEAFADSKKLTAHFRDPMAELMKWHSEHAAKIEQFKPPKNKKLK